MSKLHIGCGQQYLPGYINLEYAPDFIDKSYRVDVLGSGMEFPFKDNSLEEIISFHVIEHMPRPQYKKSKLKKWRKNVDDFLKESFRTLRHGGKIITECPDAEKILKDIVENNNWEMIDHVYGLDRYPGDTHQWGYTKQSLAELFKKNGFDNIKISSGTDYHSVEEPSLRIEASKIGLKRINIEPTSACNLECTICTRDENKRPNANMDFNLYRSIIYQLYTLGLQDIEIRFFLSGEPLVAGKNLINMIKHASRLGFKKTLIHTNGTLLNKFGEGILNAGIGTVSISFDGADKETYEKIRINSKFEKTVGYIKAFLQSAKSFNTKTIVQTIIEYDKDKNEYELKMRDLLPGADEYYVRYPHNWNTIGNIPGSKHSAIRVKECFPSENLSIYADGKVPICCADLNGDFILADANKESILDIWINKLGDIRERMKKGSSIPELCDNCERYSNNNGHEEFNINEAEQLIESEKYDEAKTVLLNMLNSNPGSIDIRLDLGVVETLMSNYNESFLYFQDVLKSDPGNEIAVENLNYLKNLLTETINN